MKKSTIVLTIICVVCFLIGIGTFIGAAIKATAVGFDFLTTALSDQEIDWDFNWADEDFDAFDVWRENGRWCIRVTGRDVTYDATSQVHIYLPFLDVRVTDETVDVKLPLIDITVSDEDESATIYIGLPATDDAK